MTETQTITENGREVIMSVVIPRNKNENNDGTTILSPSSQQQNQHEQIIWIPAGANNAPPALYSIKQVNYSQVR